MQQFTYKLSGKKGSFDVTVSAVNIEDADQLMQAITDNEVWKYSVRGEAQTNYAKCLELATSLDWFSEKYGKRWEFANIPLDADNIRSAAVQQAHKITEEEKDNAVN